MEKVRVRLRHYAKDIWQAFYEETNVFICSAPERAIIPGTCQALRERGHCPKGTIVEIMREDADYPIAEIHINPSLLELWTHYERIIAPHTVRRAGAVATLTKISEAT